MNTENGAVIKTFTLEEAINLSDAITGAQYIKHFKKYEYDGKSKVIPIARNQMVGQSGLNYSKIIPEKQKAEQREFAFNAVKLTPKRFAEYTELSSEFENNSEADNIKIAVSRATKRFMRGIGMQLGIQGWVYNSTDDEKKVKFERLASDANSTSENMVEDGTMAFNYEEIRKNGWEALYNQGTIDGAFYILHPDYPFSVLDKNGNERLNTENVPNGAVGSLDGLPVYQGYLETRNGETIAWGIFTPDAYAMTISDVIVKKVEDSSTQLNGSLCYLVELYLDGAVQDHYGKRCYAAKPATSAAKNSGAEIVDNPMTAQATTTKKSGGKK